MNNLYESESLYCFLENLYNQPSYANYISQIAAGEEIVSEKGNIRNSLGGMFASKVSNDRGASKTYLECQLMKMVVFGAYKGWLTADLIDKIDVIGKREGIILDNDLSHLNQQALAVQLSMAREALQNNAPLNLKSLETVRIRYLDSHFDTLKPWLTANAYREQAIQILTNSNPTLAEREQDFLTKVDFSTQTYLISVLLNESTGTYFKIKEIYQKEPTMLHKLIELETEVGSSLAGWITPATSIEILDYLLENPLPRKMTLQPNSVISPEKIQKIIDNGNLRLLKQIATLSDKDSKTFEAMINYASQSPLDKTVIHLLEQDYSKSNLLPVFIPLVHYVFSQKPPDLDMLRHLLALSTSPRSMIFTPLASHISGQNKELILLFLSKLENIKNKEDLEALKVLCENGDFYLALLLIESGLLSNVNPLNAKEALAVWVGHQAKELGAAFQKVLSSWGKENNFPSYKEINKEEQEFLTRLALIYKDNPEIFPILADLSCQFPLPFGKALLKLSLLPKKHIETFATWLENFPETGARVLSFTDRLTLKECDVFFNKIALDSEEISNLFYSNNLASSLKSVTGIASSHTDYSQRTKTIPCLIKALTRPIPDFDQNKDFKKLETLYKTYPAQLSYLQQLSLLRLAYPSSIFVDHVMKELDTVIEKIEAYQKHKSTFNRNIKKNPINPSPPIPLPDLPTCSPHLISLALNGYIEPAGQLFSRLKNERPLSRWTSKMIEFSSDTTGNWVMAALNLDEEKDFQLIDKLCESDSLTSLLRGLTFLSAAGERSVGQEILKVQKKSSHQTRALSTWIEQENFTLATKVCEQDKTNQDPNYLKIRNIENPNTQESFLSFYRQEYSGLLRQFPTLIEDILAQTEPVRILSQIRYLSTHHEKVILDLLAQKKYEEIDKRFEECHPLKKLNQANQIRPLSDNMSKNEKQFLAIKAQTDFAIAVADVLLDKQGFINEQLIEEIFASDFFLTQQSQQTTVYSFLKRVLTIFKEKGEFRERISSCSLSPIQGTPIEKILKRMFKMENESEFLTDQQLKSALLSSVLVRYWQFPTSGSCFESSVLIQSQGTERLLLQSIDDYIELINTNCLERVSNRVARSAPVSYSTETFASAGSFPIHPLAHARERCMTSISISDEALHKGRGIKILFDESTGVLPSLLKKIILKSPTYFSMVKDLLNQLQNLYCTSCFVIYDPLCLHPRYDNPSDFASQTRGGWVLVDSTTYFPISDEQKYSQFLTRLVKKLSGSRSPPSVEEKECLDAFLEILDSGKLIENITQKHITLTNKDEVSPWMAYGTGGRAGIAETYFGTLSKEVNTPGELHANDLQSLYTFAQYLSDKPTTSSDACLRVSVADHAYNLHINKLIDLKKFKSFSELESHLKEGAELFGSISIDENTLKEWQDHLCSSVWLPQNKKDELKHYLTTHPIPFQSDCPLLVYGHFLADILLRIDVTSDYQAALSFVQGAVSKIRNLSEKYPPYVIVGDYNWLHPESGYDRVYAAYACNPFILESEIETYIVGEQGRESMPCWFQKVPGMSFYQVMPDHPWKSMKSVKEFIL